MAPQMVPTTVQLLSQVDPVAAREPVVGYLLSGLGVLVFYFATRVDTGWTSAHRHVVFRGLLTPSGALLLAGLATRVLAGS